MPLQSWLPDATMQSIAAEMNLAETAFFAPVGDQRDGDHYRIRWFTPTIEVDLCGHATLASGHVLFNDLGASAEKIVFESRSGPLSVARAGARLELDFPQHVIRAEPQSLPKVAACFDVKPVEMHVSDGFDAYLALFEKASDVKALKPDFTKLNALDRSVIVTARGDEPGVDFVSRYFAPTWGIPEDPVTGGAHCTLVPFWAGVLGKSTFPCPSGLGASRRTLAEARGRPGEDRGTRGLGAPGPDDGVTRIGSWAVPPQTFAWFALSVLALAGDAPGRT